MIRVFVVAKAAVVRAGLEAVVRARPHARVAGSAPSIEAITAGAGDLVLVETEPGEEEAVFALASSPEAPWVMILADANLAGRALWAGVRAVLPTDATEAQIGAAIDAVAAGLITVPPVSVDAVVRTHIRETPPTTVQPLTPREIEVLRMLAEGVPNKEIAWRLSISEHTVKFHVAQIFAKLGASSRTEAVTIGVRQGLILL